MTEEQKAYRDIAAKDGSVRMYGAVSSGTVSFLSGYDASPAKMNSSTKKYEWTPDWKGNLRNAYKNPSKIKVYETKMPNGFTAASSDVQINGYLGCLHGNETYYITSRVTSGNEEKPEMEVNRTSFKTNLSFDEILSKMNSGNPHDSVDENEERQFFR